MSVTYIDRPPRIQPELPEGEVEIPNPPEDEEKGGPPILHALLPLVTIVGYVIVSATGQGRNMMLIIPMALSVVASTVFGMVSYMKEKDAGKEKEKVYEQRLEELRREMVDSHEMQRIFYIYNYPDPTTILKIASGEENSRSGLRLWERRPEDHDFGTIRLGIGTRPSTRVYTVSESGDNGELPQMRDARQIAEESEFVSNVPVAIPMRPDPTRRDMDVEDPEKEAKRMGPRHAIGIAGDNRAKTSDFVRSIAVHYAAFHAPNDARLYVIGSQAARKRWEWAMWLPHTNTRAERYVGDQMNFDDEEVSVTAFWDDLRAELDKRALRLADKDEAGDVTLPHIMLVVDKHDVQPDSPLWTAENEAAASIIMQRGVELGASVVFVVPTPSRVPSDCQTVIEVEPVGAEMAFRYAETGLNTHRFIGTADTLDAVRAEKEFAYLIREYAVRTGFGDDITSYVDLLEMLEASKMEEIPVIENWERSKTPEGAEWIHSALGYMGGNRVRELHMSQDYDGVHGMIAGTTGSGKSELLLTLIAAIAVRYDPSIINFALVDYKGGSAFEPFRELPHTVDIVTNLEGNAVDRMFIAIKAELDRRGKVLKDYNVKHIVEYRQKGYHLKDPFPHLFIIVDEFAEMVQENAEFKARFDSITRLGRAIGVSLILATQRPTGAVTDQMRANMKFKICLRVETTDDSRELLRRSDAAFLPSNLPGRAYIQVGNENLEMMQVARAGGGYSADEDIVLDDVIWLDDEEKVKQAVESMILSTQAGLATDIPQEGGPDPNGGTHSEGTRDEVIDRAALLSQSLSVQRGFSQQEIDDAVNGRAETMVDWVVGMTAILAKRQNVPPQSKPWPDPLPVHLPLNLPIDAKYLNTERAAEGTIVLAPEVERWVEGHAEWEPANWLGKPLVVDIGVVDNPYNSEQRLLTVDLKRGPLVLFGAPGWGKTIFLRTLMLALAAKHSPDELTIYALDFGKGGLNALKALPHLGGSIDSTEEQRVERLLRMLGAMLESRRSRVTQYGSLAAYNAENPDDVLPAVLIVVDNIGELKENYENQIPTLISLVRDGRAFGIYFAVAASQTSDMPSKLYNLFTERMSLKLPDPTEYTAIVGRGAPNFNDVPGRGVVNVNRTPLEFQCAIPLRETIDDPEAHWDEGELYEELAQAMSVAWEGALPEPVEVLPEAIHIRELLPKLGAKYEKVEPILGLNDLDRKPTRIDIEKMGPHFLIAGPPLSGKTMTLRTLALSIAHMYKPHDAALILIDSKKDLYNYGGEKSLANLPHVLAAISEPEEIEEVVRRLQVEYDDDLAERVHTKSDEFRAEDQPRPAIVVVVDNYGEFGSLVNRMLLSDLAEMARKYGSEGLHFVIGGALSDLRSRDDFLKQVEAPRYSLVLQDIEAVRNMGGKVPYAMLKGEYPPGRGFIIKSVRVALTQVGMPFDEYNENVEEELDGWIDAISVEHWPEEAEWRYQGPVDLVNEAEAEEEAGTTATGGAVEVGEMAPEVQEEFEKQLREMGLDPADYISSPSSTGD